MLSLYRRHESTCKNAKKGSGYHACDCPVWSDGHVGGKRVRKSLGTRDWRTAEDRLRSLENGATGVEPEVQTKVADATAEFLGECRVRGLRPETMRHYVRTLGYFVDHAAVTGKRTLDDLSQKVVADFRASRAVAPATSRRELEVLRAFFRFCVGRGYIAKSPADGIRHRVERGGGATPFDGDELRRIVEAVDNFYRPGPEREKLRALVQLLLNTGLRISDAVSLQPHNIQGRHLVLAAQAKTDAPVKCLLDESLIRQCRDSLFVGVGSDISPEAVQIACGNARRSLRRLGKIAGVHIHPHRFRDTFACRLLSAGVDIRSVSKLLGHRSIIVTERYYAHWVTAHQQLLDDALEKLRAFEAQPSTPPKP